MENSKKKMDITIGVDIFLYDIALRSKSKDIILQLWDLGGQDRFKFIHDSYISGAKIVLLFYDLTRPDTLANIDEWIKICRKNNEDLKIVLIGNKLDRYNGDIDRLDIDAILDHYNLISHFKISSKNKSGFKELLNYLVINLEENQNIVQDIVCTL
jgi:small GTP-binding protein